MVDAPIDILIEELPLADPSRAAWIPLSKDGAAGRLTIAEILSLAEASDIQGLDAEMAAQLHGATIKTALADADELFGADSAAGFELIRYTLANMISSIFKTSRKIANAYFLSSFRLWDATSNTKGLAFDLTGITAGATRTLKMADRDTDLSKTGAELISETIVAAAVSAVDFINVLSSAFDRYVIELENISPSATGADLCMRMSTDGGSTWISTNYAYSGMATTGSGTVGGGQNDPMAQFALTTTAMLQTNAAFFGVMQLYRAPIRRHFVLNAFYATASTGSRINTVGGALSSAADSLRFFMSTGNIAAGATFRVYGVRKG